MSTYAISYSHGLYKAFSPWLGVFERRVQHPELELGDATAAGQSGTEVIVFGLGRFGRNIARRLHSRGWKILGVDFDPDVVRQRNAEGLTTLYGDLEDPELFHVLPLDRARCVLSTIPNVDRQKLLLETLREHAFAGHIALTANSSEEREELLEAGTHLVLHPFMDAANEAAERLADTASASRPRGESRTC